MNGLLLESLVNVNLIHKSRTRRKTSWVKLNKNLTRHISTTKHKSLYKTIISKYHISQPVKLTHR